MREKLGKLPAVSGKISDLAKATGRCFDCGNPRRTCRDATGKCTYPKHPRRGEFADYEGFLIGYLCELNVLNATTK